MRKSIPFSLVFLCLVIVCVLPAGAQEPVRSLKEKVESGNFLFAARGCSTCHSVMGEGGKEGPDLSRMTAWASPILGAAVMWNHVPLMAKARQERGLDWPDFKAEEIEDIFTYLHSLKRGKGAVYAFKGDPIQGEAIFTELCQKCHGPPFKGGKIGPDLALKASEMTSESEFATRMLRHAPKMLPIAQSMEIPWPQLSGSQMAGIFIFLKSFRPSERVSVREKPIRWMGQFISDLMKWFWKY